MTDTISALRFSRKPSPVLPEHRPLYKIGQILLILHLASRGGKSNLPRLHLFNWALKSKERSAQLIKAAKERQLRIRAWGFDPALAIAVRYAIAEGLIRESSASYELTENGIMLAKEIVKQSDTFATEKEILVRIGKGISKEMVEKAAKEWEI